MSAIAHAASLSLATVTTILNRLEKNGLVSLCRSVTDRRRVIVTLTDAGAAICVKVPRPLQDQFVDRFNRLPSEQHNQIVKALDWVSTMMDVKVTDAAQMPQSNESII